MNFGAFTSRICFDSDPVNSRQYSWWYVPVQAKGSLPSATKELQVRSSSFQEVLNFLQLKHNGNTELNLLIVEANVLPVNNDIVMSDFHHKSIFLTRREVQSLRGRGKIE